MTIDIKPILAFNDNYIWIITQGKDAVVVDPGQKEPVLDFLSQHRLCLRAILITHHHYDHVDGAWALAQETDAIVYGPYNPKLSMVTNRVKGGDVIDLAPIQLHLSVLDVPGHTLDHLAYYGGVPNRQKVVFCGDTLFSCGSGRIFEGNSRQMLQSLDKIKKIGKNAHLYCAHEYTQSNIRWALAVDPNNPTLLSLDKEVNRLRALGKPTLPTALSKELLVNPFLRVDQAVIKHAAEGYAGKQLSSQEQVFSALREWKNNF